MLFFIRLRVISLILIAVSIFAVSSTFAGSTNSLPQSGRLSESGQAEKSVDLYSYNQYRNAGFVAADEPEVGKIIGRVEYWTALNQGDIVFINIGTSQGAKVGDKFSVFSKDRMLVNPVKRRGFKHEEVYIHNEPYRKDEWVAHSFFLPAPMGRVIQHSGIIEIIETGIDRSKAVILKSNEVINVGFSLAKYTPIKHVMVGTDFIPPKKNLSGIILSFKRYSPTFDGDGEIVYLDLGANHKVEVGDRLVAYLIPQTEDEKINNGFITHMLPHIIGELVVINVQPDTSSALILQSDRPITPGTRVKSK